MSGTKWHVQLQPSPPSPPQPALASAGFETSTSWDGYRRLISAGNAKAIVTFGASAAAYSGTGDLNIKVTLISTTVSHVQLQDSDASAAVHMSSTVTLTRTWAQHCLSGFKPTGQGTTWVQFKFNLGTALTTFQFYQATIAQV
ncbi:hypothetical protein GPECTOR_190g295 [Gonium pectorale]|uniref:Uncharacterized protein n=1 Tax=Gonium pectorale TaxID=33097 RepID=A0A150FX47_GONPE|nr:hypothetical protein GPECTOR_190g295 [Gonium pectorale]|eukprot:KXZ42176.1 hypothetical protein GPECTOR_190g295 [Gonium pectorale]